MVLCYFKWFNPLDKFSCEFKVSLLFDWSSKNKVFNACFMVSKEEALTRL